VIRSNAIAAAESFQAVRDFLSGGAADFADGLSIGVPMTSEHLDALPDG
jgi:hypothetical protein